MLSVLSMMEDHLEDEDDDHHQMVEDDHQSHHHSLPLSKAELRKSNKPIMEKRRRARINTCLNELKSLILDAMKKDPARHSKLEKADILEMTVKHLQAVQRQQLALAVAHDPGVLTKFRGGFTECAQEVTRYVSRIEGVDGGVRQRLLQHLGQCVSGLSAMTPLSFTAMAGLPMNMNHLHSSGMPQVPPPPMQLGPGDVNNNNNQARLLHGLVAARLAAAGDTAGAALLLQGGLSLLARAGPHGPGQPSAPTNTAMTSQGSHPTAPPPAPPPSQTNIQPPQLLQQSLAKINEGASSSGERPLRPSAFTAVRRTSSPNRSTLDPHIPTKEPVSSSQQQPIVAPTARRILIPDSKQETVISAQVAVQPVNLTIPSVSSREGDGRVPLDFSFKKRPLDRPAPITMERRTPTIERPTPTHPTISIPTPQHPKASQSLPAHMTQKDVLLRHPTPMHPSVTNQMLANTASTNSPHSLPPAPSEQAPPSLTSAPSHPSIPYHTSLPPTISMPTSNHPFTSHHDPAKVPTSENYSNKRPLDDPDGLSPPSKIQKTDQLTQHPMLLTVPTSSSVAPPPGPPILPIRESSPMDAPLPPKGPSPPQTHCHPGPSPQKTSSVPSPHPVRTSPIRSTTPKREVTSEDNSSPNRPSTSTSQEDKDMWRPW